ncbi:hypothetical protein N7510_004181 [Penicillium lagena]|uniref:uncharacterized protein n=1 Tax=Penicillium lagena TaxID=94218 RepID=UPI0025425170|nr:uncharacterized protein N7510_004181 [Penicillium lagena]KAJ5620197.1 hypothetical protein N7510_004181 [Penicillium lagena]
MGRSTDAVPPYEELYAQPPANASTGYTAVLQADHEDHQGVTDVELHAQSGPDVEAQPHKHCEECDKVLERRERRRGEKYCCTMVSVTFIVAFVCLMLFGIVLVSGKKGKH